MPKKKAPRFNLASAFKKARAAMHNPKRKACKHGHAITASNANVADLQRTGKYFCDPCIKMYAAGQKKKNGKTKSAVPNDPETALKESFRFAAARFAKVPEAEQMEWAQNLSGMLLRNAGVKRSRQIQTVAIPKGFGIVRRSA